MPAIHEDINRDALELETRAAKRLGKPVAKFTFGIVVKVSKLTTGAIGNALEAVGLKAPGIKHGKQTLRALSAQNAGLSSIELSNPDLRLLNKIMKQNGVDFAPVKTEDDKYLLFFKGRDADAITYAFNQYMQKVVKQADKEQEKPSVNKELSSMKEKAAQQNAQHDKVKNKHKEQSL